MSAAVATKTETVGSVCSTLVMTRVALAVATSGRGQTARSAIRAGTGQTMNPTQEKNVLASTKTLAFMD